MNDNVSKSTIKETSLLALTSPNFESSFHSIGRSASNYTRVGRKEKRRKRETRLDRTQINTASIKYHLHLKDQKTDLRGNLKEYRATSCMPQDDDALFHVYFDNGAFG